MKRQLERTTVMTEAQKKQKVKLIRTYDPVDLVKERQEYIEEIISKVTKPYPVLVKEAHPE